MNDNWQRFTVHYCTDPVCGFEVFDGARTVGRFMHRHDAIDYCETRNRQLDQSIWIEEFFRWSDARSLRNERREARKRL